MIADAVFVVAIRHTSACAAVILSGMPELLYLACGDFSSNDAAVAFFHIITENNSPDNNREQLPAKTKSSSPSDENYCFYLAESVGFEPTWLLAKRFSRPPRYDRFDIPANYSLCGFPHAVPLYNKTFGLSRSIFKFEHQSVQNCGICAVI